MNYKITVNNKTYEVQIKDINARPVVATVDGVRFEVMPENGATIAQKKDTEEHQNLETKHTIAPATQSILSSHTLTAPLPGTVTEVFVKAGDEVEMGKVILIIEAMKMKNSIRSTHSGKIEEVFISAGQSVGHKQALVKFAE
jgi:biotin carboxyl carrier protein